MGADAVVLERQIDIEIFSERRAVVRSRTRLLVQSQRGADLYRYSTIYYNPWMPIKDVQGWVTQPSGKRVKLKKQNISDQSAFASFELYADSRMRVLHFPSVTPGSILEHTYTQEIDALIFLPTTFLFREDLAVGESILSIRYPGGFPLSYALRGGAPAPDREESGGVVHLRWSLSDLPPLRREPGSPPPSDFLPGVVLHPGLMAWDEHVIESGSWDGIAGWYLDLARDRMEPGEEVASAAAEIAAAATDPEEKIRRVYEFLQRKVNYVAVELGIGGWQPHPSADVLRRRYGDCKDKATLMIAMLRSIGLDGYPVLIRTRDAGRIDPARPSPGFNHAIVAVPRPQGYLFLDPTSESTPFGDLPWSDQGVDVLVVAEGHGEIVRTPLFPPERNLLRIEVSADVKPNGDLEGALSVEAHGQRRAALAAALEGAGTADQAAALGRYLAELCPGALLRGHEVRKADDPAEPLRIVLRFDLPRYVTQAGSLHLLAPHLVRSPALTDLIGGEPRRQPLLFRFLHRDSSEVRLRLPAGRTLRSVPDPVELEGAGIRASTAYSLGTEEGRTVLVVQRDVEVSRREMSSAEFAGVQELIEDLGRLDARAVTLVPEGA